MKPKEFDYVLAETTGEAFALLGASSGFVHLMDEMGRLGKSVALPEGSRKQVDQVIDRLSDVRGDVNKRVDAVRSDLEKQVTSIRKQTEKRSRKLTSVVQKQARKYAEDLFKSLRLPVRKDLDAIKRRLTSIERRIDELAKTRKAA